jgi:hypothetical protein
MNFTGRAGQVCWAKACWAEARKDKGGAATLVSTAAEPSTKRLREFMDSSRFTIFLVLYPAVPGVSFPSRSARSYFRS